MATLFQRLTESGDISPDTPIHLHSWEAVLNEYARGKVTSTQLAAMFSHSESDSQWIALFEMIDNESTVVQKLLKVQEITDVLIAHSDSQTNDLYPTGLAVRNRLLE